MTFFKIIFKWLSLKINSNGFLSNLFRWFSLKIYSNDFLSRFNSPANGFCESTLNTGECLWPFKGSDPTSTGRPDCAETLTENRSTIFTGDRKRKSQIPESLSNRSTSLWNDGGEYKILDFKIIQNIYITSLFPIIMISPSLLHFITIQFMTSVQSVHFCLCK